ncbi:hypothetical protein J1N35_014553 [Gossypium stocksii]|uniref:Uncharacterized protein n=1 Tax=Gossypium stocksii TaxID=47602 RepID=A0A9D3VV61_9ROSI|nr:hypothetical protein J1N35_014553 [Gossypium stocksii]
MNGEFQLKADILSHVSSKNFVMELFIKFADADGSGLSSATIATYVGTEAEVECPTTRFCGEFTNLLQRSYYDIPKISIGEEEEVANAVDEVEPDPSPIRQCSLDGLEVALFFEPDLVPTEPEPYESSDDGSNNALDLDQ